MTLAIMLILCVLCAGAWGAVSVMIFSGATGKIVAGGGGFIIGFVIVALFRLFVL